MRSEDECWPWRRSLGSHGYGQIGWSEGDRHWMVLTHRVAYEMTVGPITDDLTVDHVCRNKRCCNPGHLRLLSNVENARLNGNAIKSQCIHGHAFTTENTRINRIGHRCCRACDRSRGRSRREVAV